MKLKTLCVIIGCLALQIVAQDMVMDICDTTVKGQVQGRSTSFEVTNSEYLNITLTSSSPVKLTILSIPRTIYFTIDSTGEDSSATFRINGLESNCTYYAYDNSGKLFDIRTDGSGSAAFTQDLTHPHTFWIQPGPSTLYLRTLNNVTGWFDGNNIPVTDGSLGWDAGTRTAYFYANFNQTVYIQLDDVVVEGNGHTLTGSGYGNGVVFSSHNVVLRHLTINGFSAGALVMKDSITIENCSFSGNTYGIYSNYAEGLSGDWVVFKDNVISVTSGYGIVVRYYNTLVKGNVITGPGMYSGVGIISDYSGILCRVEDNVFNTINMGFRAQGITTSLDPIALVNNEFNDNNYGVWLQTIKNIVITNNRFNRNSTGISFSKVKNSIAKNNVFLSNGVGMGMSDTNTSNIIYRNAFEQNSNCGIYMYPAFTMNTVFNNKFNNNTNVRFNPYTTNDYNYWQYGIWKGNWWNNHQITAPYIIDVNYNKNIDNGPYVFSWDSFDQFPVPDNIAPASNLALSVPEPDGENGWYKQNVTATLTPSDLGGAGVWYTVCSQHKVPPMISTYYSGPITYTEGKYNLKYYSVDKFGNIEEAKGVKCKIDTRKPVIYHNVTGTQTGSWYNSDVIINIYSYDPYPASGMQKWGYKFNMDDYTYVEQSSLAIPYSNQGINQMYLWGKDTAGNDYAYSTLIYIDKYAPEPVIDPLPELRGLYVKITKSPAAIDNLSGTIYGTTTDPLEYDHVGSYLITWKYDDRHGNVSTQTQRVTIVTDETAPVPDVNPLPDATGECAVTVTPPTATDDFAGVVTATTSSPLTYTTQGTYTIIWTYTDGKNTRQQQQNVIVKDNTAPVITSVPADITVEATGPQTAVSIQNAAATDNCGTVTVSSNAPAMYRLGATAVIFTATDAAGNTREAAMTVTITDKTSPVAPQISAVESECSYTIQAAPAASDLVDGTITGTSASGSVPFTISALGEHIIVWTFIDNSGNKSTAQQKIKIVDTTAPEFTSVSPNITAEATGPQTAVSIANAVAHDNCGTVTVSSNAPATFGLGVTMVTFTAVDVAGNTKQATMTVTITDKTAPVAPQISPVESECSYTIQTAPLASDLVDGTIAGTTVSGALPLIITGLGEHSVVWTFTDNSGNTSTTQQIIKIVDKTAPEFISVPPNITAEATGPQTAVTIANAVAQDNCGTVTVSSNAPASYVPGVTTVTFSATDAAGNTKQATMTVTITDKTAPLAPHLDPVEHDCSFKIDTAPVAMDVVDGTIAGATTAGTLPLIINGLGVHTIVWTFTDNAGNKSTTEQVITIVDTTAPQFSFVPENTTVEATGTQTAVTIGTAVATDNCGSVTVTSNAPSSYVPGVTTVIFTATDAAGNTQQATMTVTITDKTAPLAPHLGPVERECSYTIETAPIASDLVDGTITGTTMAGTLPLIINELGVHTIVWTFTDNAGNRSTSEQLITIVDTTAPQFTFVPENTTVEATGQQTGVTIANAVATDNCGSVSVTSNAPATYGLGETTVTFTATDVAGNTQLATVKVTLTDKSAPLAPRIDPVESECSYTIETAPVATDLVDGTITGITAGSLPLIINELGEHSVVWTFTDENGNTSTAEQVVTIVDNTAPQFTFVPDDITIEANGPLTAVSIGSANAQDNCGSVSVISDAPETFAVGVTNITFIATDPAGNSNRDSLTVTVTDNTAPVAPQIDAIESECAYVIENAPIAYDLVDGEIAGTTVSGPLPLEINGLGEHTIVWEFTDRNGNKTVSDQRITIIDTTEPQFTSIPSDTTVEATGPNTAVFIRQADAQDNCGTVDVSSDASDQYSTGTTTVRFIAKDLAGNTALDSMTVNITDKTAPAAPQIAPVEYECSYRIETAPTAVDLVDGIVTGVTTSGSLPIEISGLGIHTIVWSFTDSHGNRSDVEQVVTIIDVTPPQFTVVPPPVTIEATGPQTRVSVGNAAAQDNCGTVTVGSNVRETYPVGVNTVTYTATDAAGNTSTAQVTVTVTDVTPPVAPRIPAVEGGCYYVMENAPVATDLVDGTITGVADAGLLPFTVTGYGDHTIRWTFTDRNGNSSYADQIVSIRMNTRVYMFDEALVETNISKPRLYIQNNGKVNISNFKVEYYFRADNGYVPVIENYYTPNATIKLVDLGYNYYKVVYSFSNITIKPGQIFPNTSGSVIGIHYPRYESLDKRNDYSNNLSAVFAENGKICVFTAENRLISGTPLFVNAEPVACAGENITLVDREGNGETVDLNASNSYDPDGSVAKYEWYLGDTLLSQESIHSVQLSKGMYQIRLKVTDNRGISSSDTIAVVINTPESNLSFSINSDPIPLNTPVTLSYQIPSSMAGAKVRVLLERTWDVLPWNLSGTAGAHQLQIYDWTKYFFGGSGPWTIRFEVNGVVVDSKQISFNY